MEVPVRNTVFKKISTVSKQHEMSKTTNNDHQHQPSSITNNDDLYKQLKDQERQITLAHKTDLKN